MDTNDTNKTDPVIQNPYYIEVERVLREAGRPDLADDIHFASCLGVPPPDSLPGKDFDLRAVMFSPILVSFIDRMMGGRIKQLIDILPPYLDDAAKEILASWVRSFVVNMVNSFQTFTNLPYNPKSSPDTDYRDTELYLKVRLLTFMTGLMTTHKFFELASPEITEKFFDLDSVPRLEEVQELAVEKVERLMDKDTLKKTGVSEALATTFKALINALDEYKAFGHSFMDEYSTRESALKASEAIYEKVCVALHEYAKASSGLSLGRESLFEDLLMGARRQIEEAINSYFDSKDAPEQN